MIKINVKIRKNKGKSASRRLRFNNKIPCVLYGKNIDTLLIELKQKDILKIQNKKIFFNKFLILNINGVEKKVKVKAIQKHPFKEKLTHIDFYQT